MDDRITEEAEARAAMLRRARATIYTMWSRGLCDDMNALALRAVTEIDALDARFPSNKEAAHG